MSDLDQSAVETVAPVAQAEAPAQAQTTEIAPASAVSDGAAQQPDIEARAKAMGWVPKEQFRGPAEAWRDADEFVRRGEEDLPVVRERNRELMRKVSDLERQVGSLGQTYEQRIQALDRMNAMALNRQRDQLLASYDAAMRQAVEIGDVTRYDQLRSDMGRAVSEFDNQVTQVVKQPVQQPQWDERGFIALPATDAAVRNTWLAQNGWFQTDPELNAVAQQAHMRIGKEKPGLSLEQNLGEVTKYIRQKYPEKFGLSERSPSPVEGGGGRLPARSNGRKGAADLPADARKVAERQIKDGLFKDMNEYAALYFEEA